MALSRDFKGIWVSKEIWLNKSMTILEKMFYVEISSLDNSDGCFASNAHFAEHFGKSKNRCTEIIKSLEKKNLISIEYQKKNNRIVKRILRIKGIRKTDGGYSENRDRGIRKTEGGYSENREGNNTCINNTIERESTHAFDFLKIRYPSRFEQEFLMAYGSKIKDLEKFELDFNATVDKEELNYVPKVLFARLGQYARNWIQNQDKFNKQDNEQQQQQPNYRNNAI